MSQRPIHDIEAKWQKIWQEEKTYQAETPSPSNSPSGSGRDLAEKFYGLVEFPYPSGDGLHVGHPRSYTAIDVITRKQRMQGKNVMYPIGWDAFGLPTENYAIKNKIKPSEATKKNIGNFTRQIKSIGFGFDWSREVDTTDPAYFKWTQWQFLQFFKHGLAYKAKSTINWCPKDKIGLANEEAQGGICERCGTAVEKREKEQWMIRITDYAQRLLSDLDSVNYLDKIKSQQINWIGKSEGAEIVFRVPKFSQVMIATSNKSKLARVKKMMKAVLPSIEVLSPVEAGVSEQDVQEGDDLLDNARIKAEAYAGKTDLPIIGMDTGLFIAGETLNIAAPKRNALEGADEASLTQAEKAAKMDAFYRAIATKHGGEVEAYWLDATVLRLPDGTECSASNKREIVITSERKGEVDIYFPVRGIYRVKATGKYVAEQSEEEEMLELQPLVRAFAKVCSEEVRVFTTRPDTLFGVTYVTLAPEHALVQEWLKSGRVKNVEAVREYIAGLKAKSDMERTAETKDKTGIVLEGVEATHPVTGESLPIWIADYVLAGYGTGAVMAVPAHDERDFAFAEKYQLPIKQVVAPYIVAKDVYEPRSDKPTTTRLVTSAIIRHASTGKYLLLNMKDGRRGFPGGGIEDGESEEGAIRRELREETGYSKIVSLKKLFNVVGHGYKPKKDTNCCDPDTIFFIEVDGEPDQSPSEEDQKGHEMVWKDESEVSGYINLVHHQYAWQWMMKQDRCFVEEGMVINSGILNGAPTWKAKEDMVSWLEEFKAGKQKVSYKLRDWVFSRQRYWGEPIPLVHCGTCAKKKQKALIIHGMGASAESVWYPTLKKALEKEGFEVFAPSAANSLAPVYEDWMSELRPALDQLGEDDVIIGHSLGGLMALHAVAEMNRKIGHVYLVGPLVGPIADEQWEAKKLRNTKKDYDKARAIWERPIDWEKITRLVGAGQVLTSSDDPHVPAATHQIFPEGWFIHHMGEKGHFNDPQSPEVIQTVLMSKATGWVPLSADQLPLTLPAVEVYEPTDTGESPLAKMHDWVNTTCPRCGGEARRETDTMPNWAGSSWYFLRYCDPHNNEALASRESLKYWMPVDLYNGGMEHTTLHLLYSRFWYKFLWDLGVVPEECGSEPYSMRRSHNMILGEGGVKMSKSKGNVVNPDDVVSVFGADVFRVYEMFIGPYDQPAPWDTNGIEGVRRFLDRVWTLFDGEAKKVSANQDLETLYNQTVKKITDDIDNLQFNTCVSQLMILTNAFQDLGGVPAEMVEGYVKLLAPFAPHLAEEIWRTKLGYADSIHVQTSGWPIFDAAKLQAAMFDLVVQVNGKVREKIKLASGVSDEEAKAAALGSEQVQRWMEGKSPKQVIYIKGRLVNIVV